MYVLLTLTTIQMINNAINKWLYKGMQTSHAPVGFEPTTLVHALAMDPTSQQAL